MNQAKELLDHIEEIHTTDGGAERIKRNLKIEQDDVVGYCKNRLLDQGCSIYRRGKNWYCEIGTIRMTINAHSYTIITAHIIK